MKLAKAFLDLPILVLAGVLSTALLKYIAAPLKTKKREAFVERYSEIQQRLSVCPCVQDSTYLAVQQDSLRVKQQLDALEAWQAKSKNFWYYFNPLAF